MGPEGTCLRPGRTVNWLLQTLGQGARRARTRAGTVGRKGGHRWTEQMFRRQWQKFGGYEEGAGGQ